MFKPNFYFGNQQSSNVKYTKCPDKFLENVTTQRSIDTSEHKTLVLNYVEKYNTDYAILDKLKAIGNSLGFFGGNMLRSGTLVKAEAIARSMITDIKIFLLTEALAYDIIVC